MMLANDAASPVASEIAEAMAPLRREFIIEALDGAVYQAEGAIRFLNRGEDACAAKAMARMFDFARTAAGEMKTLRGDLPLPAKRTEMAD